MPGPDDTVRQEAENPSTSPQRLLELTAQHPELRRSIVGNPSCPAAARDFILALDPEAGADAAEEHVPTEATGAGTPDSEDTFTYPVVPPETILTRAVDPETEVVEPVTPSESSPGHADSAPTGPMGSVPDTPTDQIHLQHAAGEGTPDGPPNRQVPTPPSLRPRYERVRMPGTPGVVSPVRRSATSPTAAGPTAGGAGAAGNGGGTSSPVPPTGIAGAGGAGAGAATRRGVKPTTWLLLGCSLLLVIAVVVTSAFAARSLFSGDLSGVPSASAPAASSSSSDPDDSAPPGATASAEPTTEDPTTEEESETPTEEDYESPAPEDATTATAVTSPSGNIRCSLGENSVGCTLKENSFGDSQQTCSGSFSIKVSDGNPALACGTNYGGGSPTELGYKKVAVRGEMACSSASTGMTCWNQRTGHGFTVSREEYQSF